MLGGGRQVRIFARGGADPCANYPGADVGAPISAAAAAVLLVFRQSWAWD